MVLFDLFDDSSIHVKFLDQDQAFLSKFIQKRNVEKKSCILFDFSICSYNDSCSLTLGQIQSIKSQGIGYRLLTLIIKTFGGGFYSLNFVSSLLFVIPLLKFCSNLSRPYLAVLISYPYLITVIGLGTIRQSIAIAFLLICINQLKKYKFLNFYILNFFSILFHYSSSIFLFLPFLIDLKKRGNLKLFRNLLYVIFLIFIVFYSICIAIFYKNDIKTQ